MLPMRKKLIISLVVVCLFIILFFVYINVTYIDNKVIEGEAYGFTIGNTKSETFHKAKKVFNNNKIFILYPLDNNGYGPHKVIQFEKDEYELICDRDKWKFFYDESFFDFLELNFQEDILRSVYRHRKKFELP